jgi:hypothetical protein
MSVFLPAHGIQTGTYYVNRFVLRSDAGMAVGGKVRRSFYMAGSALRASWGKDKVVPLIQVKPSLGGFVPVKRIGHR